MDRQESVTQSTLTSSMEQLSCSALVLAAVLPRAVTRNVPYVYAVPSNWTVVLVPAVSAN